jgi:hypothetical protein
MGRQVASKSIPEHLRPLWREVSSGDLGVVFTNSTHRVQRVHEPLWFARLREAVEALGSRHRILACRIGDEASGPAFLFEPKLDLCVISHDVSSSEDAEAEARKIAHQLTWAPFEPARGPLMRTFVIRISARDFVLGIVIHHFVADLVTVGIVWNELLDGYARGLQGKGQIAQSSTIAFEDYISQIETRIAAEGKDKLTAFWRQYLRDAPATSLPRRPEPADSRQNLVAEMFRIDRRSAQALRHFAASHGVTLFVVLLLAKVDAIRESTSLDDISLLFFSWGRYSPKLMGCVGALFKLLHFRVRLSGRETLDERLAKVRTAYLSAIRHQDCPLWLVREIRQGVGAATDLPYAPSFNFTDRYRSGAADAKRTATTKQRIEPFDIGPPPPVPTRATEFESHYFQLQGHADGIDGLLRYSPVLYERSVVRSFLDHFSASVQRICAAANGNALKAE